MNSIVKKTIEKISTMKTINKEYFHDLKHILEKGSVINKKLVLMNTYNFIEAILVLECGLTDYEMGYILSKLIHYNYLITKENFFLCMDLKALKKDDRVVNQVLSYDLDENIESLTNIFKDYFVTDEEDIFKIRKSYEYIDQFSYKPTHIKSEYEQLNVYMDYVGITPILKKAIIKYYNTLDIEYEKKCHFKEELKKQKNKEKKVVEIKQIKKKEVKKKIIPRGQLKKRLNELYKPNMNEQYFDIENIEEVLKLLKELSISDERVKLILNDLYRCSIRNEKYYEYLVKKAKYINEKIKRVRDLKDVEEAIELSKDEDEEIRQEAMDLLNELYEKIEYVMREYFDFEKDLVNNVLKLERNEKNE